MKILPQMTFRPISSEERMKLKEGKARDMGGSGTGYGVRIQTLKETLFTVPNIVQRASSKVIVKISVRSRSVLVKVLNYKDQFRCQRKATENLTVRYLSSIVMQVDGIVNLLEN